MTITATPPALLLTIRWTGRALRAQHCEKATAPLRHRAIPHAQHATYHIPASCDLKADLNGGCTHAGWIDGLRALANREVSDDQFAKAKFRFPVNTPATKEA